MSLSPIVQVEYFQLGEQTSLWNKFSRVNYSKAKKGFSSNTAYERFPRFRPYLRVFLQFCFVWDRYIFHSIAPMWLYDNHSSFSILGKKQGFSTCFGQGETRHNPCFFVLNSLTACIAVVFTYQRHVGAHTGRRLPTYQAPLKISLNSYTSTRKWDT